MSSNDTAAATINTRIVLAQRPQGAVTAQCFRLEHVPLPPLAEGQLLVRHRFLSLDPYMRGRMDDAKSYAVPQPLGETMIGGTVGEVVASRHPKFAVGDTVVGMGGWQTHAISDGTLLRKVDARAVPASAYLGAVGMPGVTAWYGVRRILEPQAGQTLVVSAASGAVGGVVGQLARRAGARAVGIAGGAQKCRIVVEELGFDACVDYRDPEFEARLADATPDGIDRLFENVGGTVLDAALRRMNAFGRVAVCGLISGYDGAPMPIREFRSVLINRLRVEGFIVSEHMELWPEALAELGALVAGGALRYRETVAEGLAAAPEAFLGLLAGRNVGKQLVRL